MWITGKLSAGYTEISVEPRRIFLLAPHSKTRNWTFTTGIPSHIGDKEMMLGVLVQKSNMRKGVATQSWVLCLFIFFALHAFKSKKQIALGHLFDKPNHCWELKVQVSNDYGSYPIHIHAQKIHVHPSGEKIEYILKTLC